MFALEWLEYRVLLRSHPFAAWLGLFALAFMALGGWVSYRLFRRPPPGPFAINTAKTHVANLFAKLGVKRRTEAIFKARELGILR